MKTLESISLSHHEGCLKILDQKQLPKTEFWQEIKSPEDMIEAIEELKVRGAPLIGVAAAVALGKYSESGATEKEFLNAAKALRESRPTAVNLMFAIDKLTNFEVSYNVQEIVTKAEKLFIEDVELCERMANLGETLIKEGDNILTHCNTGGLATVGSGTALGVIRKAFENGKKIHVYVDETRPLLQGGRLTTWELEKYGIPYTLICDNMAASLMAEGKIQKVFLGSDRIAVNGDFANKIGTYNVAIIANYHKIPFYCVAPYTTVDFACESGVDIPIELRKDSEVRGVSGSFGDVEWAPAKSVTHNPAFDVTPFNLVSGWILDNKVYTQSDIQGEKGLCLQS